MKDILQFVLVIIGMVITGIIIGFILISVIDNFKGFDHETEEPIIPTVHIKIKGGVADTTYIYRIKRFEP